VGAFQGLLRDQLLLTLCERRRSTGLKITPLCFHWSVNDDASAVNISREDPSISSGTANTQFSTRNLVNQCELLTRMASLSTTVNKS
jgi:hypothetical protein